MRFPWFEYKINRRNKAEYVYCVCFYNLNINCKHYTSCPIPIKSTCCEEHYIRNDDWVRLLLCRIYKFAHCMFFMKCKVLLGKHFYFNQGMIAAVRGAVEPKVTGHTLNGQEKINGNS